MMYDGLWLGLGIELGMGLGRSWFIVVVSGGYKDEGSIEDKG